MTSQPYKAISIDDARQQLQAGGSLPAELLEIFQWDEKADIQNIKKDEKTMDKIKEEVADVMMYILCLSNQLDLDISEAVLAKLEKNRTKYDKNVVLETGAYRKDKL